MPIKKQMTSPRFRAKVLCEIERLKTTIQRVHDVCYGDYKGFKMFMLTDTACITPEKANIIIKALAKIERENIAQAKAAKKAGKK